MGFFEAILLPFRWLMSWILGAFHTVLGFIGMPSDSGWTWALSILLLVILIRTLLIPIFVKQIKAQRAMQAMQPELQKLQAKYKGKKDQLSRQAMAMEQQALMKEHKANPFAACLPLLVQMPFFFALYQVLIGARGAAESGESMDALSADQIRSFESSEIFGAQMSDTFLGSTGSHFNLNVIVVAIFLILLMSGLMFYMQKMLMTKNMTDSQLSGPMAQTQQIMLYGMPLIFGIGGINFPIGVLLYWTYSNMWAVGQQWWIIRNNPTPGSLAERELNERRAAKGLPPVGKALQEQKAREEAEAQRVERAGQRRQPQRKNRRKK
ncbi:membrane protein insertase YidC [Micrococcus lylae]|uniref:membrane protein insertase YidC n=1 Tax=Micrococcus lylae TaxID=1273 RepID=UPI0021A8DC20|nr:membrane protein insertase YidC [Micrococcus lylae]MCT2006843.1 membrane protein insertase YidC [Micrococcus lylae]MCT2070663.1 membrane protein insertase YidC [Micrococcus lylae]